MDPNNSNQDSPNVGTAPLQPQPVVDQTQTPIPQNNENTDPNNNQVQSADQAVQDPAAVDGNYINEVGEDLIDLLDEISENNELLQVVASEMQLDTNKVQSMLASVLDKIDKEQITTEDIALIMAATAADETPDNG
jgi:hypothetical protein